jgi:hypothetical protein
VNTLAVSAVDLGKIGREAATTVIARIKVGVEGINSSEPGVAPILGAALSKLRT